MPTTRSPRLPFVALAIYALSLAHSAQAQIRTYSRFDPSVLTTAGRARYDESQQPSRYPGGTYYLDSDTNFPLYANGTASATATTSFLQGHINDCAAAHMRLFIPSGTFRINGNGINLPDNSCIEWENGAWIRPQNASKGSWFTNLRKETAPGSGIYARQRTYITLINPQIDGADIVTSGTDYRGDNAMGFAGGVDLDAHGQPLSTFSTVSNVAIFGGHVQNFRANYVQGGPGGKGINFEEGVADCRVEGLSITNCTHACFVSPTYPDPNKYIRHITFENIKADHCGALFYYLGDCIATTAIPPSDDPNVSSVSFTGSGSCIGHFPDRIVSGNHEKGGAIVISAGANIILNASVFNPIGFPSVADKGGGTLFPGGYPNITSGTNTIRAGAGLSGPIGAVVWGWGRNCDITVNYTGDCDDTIRIQRSRAHGLDHYPTSASTTKPVGALHFNVTVSQSGTASTPLRYGQVALNSTIDANNSGQAYDYLPDPASLRDDEYVGLDMQLTAQDGTLIKRMVVDYKGLLATPSGTKHAIYVDSNWSGSNGLPDTTYANMPFALGSTHAPLASEISGTITVRSGLTINGQHTGTLTLNPTYTHDAQTRSYDKYTGVTMVYPVP
ncbi:hypothetical protein BH09VER1_BH09VER1_48660 [soil metagenome]